MEGTVRWSVCGPYSGTVDRSVCIEGRGALIWSILGLFESCGVNSVWTVRKKTKYTESCVLVEGGSLPKEMSEVGDVPYSVFVVTCFCFSVS